MLSLFAMLPPWLPALYTYSYNRVGVHLVCRIGTVAMMHRTNSRTAVTIHILLRTHLWRKATGTDPMQVVIYTEHRHVYMCVLG